LPNAAVNGTVIWITGLSGSGKTTLARELLSGLREPKLLLDGDDLRLALSGLIAGYDAESRLKLASTYARLCKLASAQGLNAVCSTVSMFHSVREWNRRNIASYIEVYLQSSSEACSNHDYKNVYSNTKLSPVVGVHIAPELPKAPDLVFAAHQEPARAIALKILKQYPKLAER
jgi:adenylylsulfate kinase